MRQDNKHDVEVVVFAAERYDGQWFPEKLEETVIWLQDKLAEIPEEYRSAAKIEIDSVGSYEDTHYASVSISYWRPPTDAEIEERNSAKRKRLEEEAERYARHAAAAREALTALT